MKTKFIITTIFIAALAAGAGWFAARRYAMKAHDHGAEAKADGGRKILYYQSAMHPWIKSDKPGNCTICGMKLVPVFEGDKGFDTAEGLVTLSSNTINVLHVQTTPAQRRPLVRTLRVAGVIDDDDTKHRILSAYVGGRIDKLVVNYVGAEVEEGQPLATLYSPMLLNAQREYVTLLKQKKLPAFADLKDEQEQLISAARLRLKQFGLTDAQIETLNNKPEEDLHIEILAPMAGTVVSRMAYAGQYVMEGEKLFEIADFSKMWFKFDAYERDLAWIKVGQRVDVTTPAAPGKVFNAAITFIDPNLNDPTRSAKVRVELENPLVEKDGAKRRELYHKLYAEALVHVEIPETLAVLRSAVLSPGREPVVYVDKGGGAYEQRKVKLGRAGDEYWEVLDGVAEGDAVVTQGNMLIDAQAQLNHDANAAGGHQHGAPTPSTPTTAPATLPPFTDAQSKAAEQFLAVADSVRDALAADDLAKFNAEAMKLHTAIPELVQAFAGAGGWEPLVQAINQTGHLPAGQELKATRKQFHPFSNAVVEFAKAARAQEAFNSLKVFKCPMLNMAFPGAPRVGEWMQLKEPIRNPYFGAEMLDCGTEVK
ncbi:MAG: efflux RND transporter periplasmic adaptor subunit [Verrucomicrobiota bacterium]